MRQLAPEPEALLSLVSRTTYKPHWTFALRDIDRGQGSEGLTLIIRTYTPDSNAPENWISVHHYMIVPAAAYDARAWQRWLFEQIRLVESHEAAEFFMVNGERPYAPSHGPGSDPYAIRDLMTDVDVRTTFKGEVLPR